MGWTRVEVHTDELNARLAVIENEVRALLGEDMPKGEISFYNIHFKKKGDRAFWPVMIDKDGVSVFKHKEE